jgi:hypothetical protein
MKYRKYLRRKKIVRVRFQAMFHANAGTGVEMVRDTAEDTRTEGREGCVQDIVDCETRRRQRLKTCGCLSAGLLLQTPEQGRS